MRIVVVQGSKGLIHPYVMDGFIEAFRAFGHKVFVLNLGTTNQERDMRRLREFSPQLAIGYNTFTLISNAYTYLFRQLGIKSVLLFYDCPFFSLTSEQITEVTNNHDYYIIMIWDKSFREIALKIGLKNIYPIQLAANQTIFYKKNNVKVNNKASFVGNILVQNPYESNCDVNRASCKSICKDLNTSYYMYNMP